MKSYRALRILEDMLYEDLTTDSETETETDSETETETDSDSESMTTTNSESMTTTNSESEMYQYTPRDFDPLSELFVEQALERLHGYLIERGVNVDNNMLENFYEDMPNNI